MNKTNTNYGAKETVLFPERPRETALQTNSVNDNQIQFVKFSGNRSIGLD